jgi:hypothetical protein
MSDTPQDFLTRAVGYAVGFLGVGGLLGYLQYRLQARRLPADSAYTIAQTDAVRAQIRRDDRAAEFAELRGLVQEAWANVALLKHEAAEQRQRAERAETRIAQLLEEQKARHKMVNELNAFRLRDLLMREKGMTYEEAQAQPIEPIYPEAEQ